MICPCCGETVHAVDTLNTEWLNGKYYDEVEGTCPSCGRMYNWVEVYAFEGYGDVREIDLNDHL